jgi:cell division protein FtsN
MASKEKKSGGDFVLESRHLVGLFLLLVVIFGVVFTLGYLLGRSQYDSKLRAAVGAPPGTDPPAATAAAKSKTKPEAEDAQVPKKNSDWDFYHSADPQAAADHLQAPAKSVNASAPSAAAAKPKKFPAFVIPPGADKYFRVQVGPYADNQSASNARQQLEANGFKSIIKR